MDFLDCYVDISNECCCGFFTPPSRRSELAPDQIKVASAKTAPAMAELSHRSFEQMRVAILEFLDTDVFSISVEGCASFLDPMIDFWDIDLRTFALEIGLNRRLAPQSIKRFEFAERQPAENAVEPALEEFLRNSTLSGDITEQELHFLRGLKFNGRQPSPLYYYRELQNLRDPLHFSARPATILARRKLAWLPGAHRRPGVICQLMIG